MSLLKRLPHVRGTYRENAELSKTNWFRVGGPAEVLYRPADLEDLVEFLKAKPFDIDVTILGVGSNVIIRDGGIKGVVLKFGREFAQIENLGGNEFKVGSAMLNFNFAQFCLENSLTGAEFLVGIPGSIGGGIAMNAGAYGSEFKDIVTSITALDHSGNLHIIKLEDIGFAYRSNSLPDDLIYVSANIKLSNGNYEAIKEKMDHITKTRAETQPIKERTSGSTFANPTGHKAWELIDKVGLRGYNIGGAQMSEKHCNFMINTGEATAEDLENLGNFVIDKVYKETGVKLHWEIKRIGAPK